MRLLLLLHRRRNVININNNSLRIRNSSRICSYSTQNIKNKNKYKENNENKQILLYTNNSLKNRSRLLTICNMVGYGYWGTYAMPLINPAWSLPQSSYDPYIFGIGILAQTTFVYYCHLYMRRSISEIVLLEDRKRVRFTTLDLLGNVHIIEKHRDNIVAKPRFDKKSPGTIRLRFTNEDKYYVIDRLTGTIEDYERLGSILSIRLMDFIQ